jgi:CheY-like chemotaxis protein
VTSEADNSFNLSGRTILVAEDDEKSYTYLKEIMQRSGALVIHAANGKEAIEAVKLTDTIDLILMDIQMPSLDGYGATRKIKKIHPNLPIIAQTAYAMDGDKEKSILAGCDDYLTKPIDPGKLLDKIRQFLPSGTVSKDNEKEDQDVKQMTELKGGK